MVACHPVNGGCWFCHTKDDRPMLFSGEFDTYLHLRCLEIEIELDEECQQVDPEVEVFAREFGLSYNVDDGYIPTWKEIAIYVIIILVVSLVSFNCLMYLYTKIVK